MRGRWKGLITDVLYQVKSGKEATVFCCRGGTALDGRCVAEAACQRLLENIQLWLAYDIVHADLSEYNVLVWRGRPVVIDFPQAVDPRFNRNAYSLLQRDLANLYRHFERLGVRRDPRALSAALWERWLHSDAWLGMPEGAPVE